MSHTTISPVLIQLFEAESRIVDQLLAQKQDGKYLWKPAHLQGRKLPLPLGPQSTGKSADSAKKCQGSSHDSVKVKTPNSGHQDVDISLSEMFSLTAIFYTKEIDEPLVQLTRTSFTAQDPVSAAIDALHSDLSRADELKQRLIKPNSNSRLLRNNMPTLLETFVLPNGLQKNRKSVQSIQSGQCCNLQRRKSFMVEKEANMENTAPKRRRTSNGFYSVSGVVESPLLAPDSSYDFSNKHASENIPCKNGRKIILDAVNVDRHSDGENDCSSGANQTCSSILLDPKQRKHCPNSNNTIPNIQSDLCYNLRKRKTFKEEKETIVENSVRKRCTIWNGCDNVPATVLESPTLVPDSSYNFTKEQVSENNRLLRKRPCKSCWKITLDAVGGGENDCPGQHAQGKTDPEAHVAELSHKKQNGRQVKTKPKKCSAVVVTARQILRRRRRIVGGRSTNLLYVSCKHGVLSTECQICKLTRTDCKKNAAPLKTVSKAVNKTSSVKTINIMPFRTIQKLAKNRKCKQSDVRAEHSLKHHIQSTSSTRTALSKSKANHAKTVGSKAKSSSASAIPSKPKITCKNTVQSKAKSSSASTVQSKFKAGTTKKALHSILEHHKQLSLEFRAAVEDNSFSNTKDMFSQLCQLQERSKEYDAGSLDTIMPTKQAHGEKVFTKPSSLYSSEHQSSHVGGIWKTIFSKR